MTGMRSSRDGLPEDGKIVIAAPPVAVRLVEATPAFGMRVFIMKSLPEEMVYVLDIDALNEDLRV